MAPKVKPDFKKELGREVANECLFETGLGQATGGVAGWATGGA